MVEITSEEQNKINIKKRTEDSLRDIWDNIKCINVQIIRVPEEEKKKKGHEKFFEEIIVENSSNVEKEIVNQVQEAQRVPYRINSRRNMSRHTVIKLTKTAAAAAKWLQLYSTLCGPIDSSPPGSPVPGILQARTLELVAISFSNA